MLVSALFITTKKWKYLKNPSTDEQKNKLWHIHTMDDYSAIERNEVLIQAITWKKLEDIMLSERRETQNTTYSMVPFI